MSSIDPNESARLRQNRADAEAAFKRMEPTDEQSPEAIEQEIRHTRSQMDQTLDRIQRKITGTRNDAVNDFVHNLVQAVVRNPVPVSLFGAAVAWSVFNTVRKHKVPVALIGSAVAWQKMYGPEEGHRDYHERMSYGVSPHGETAYETGAHQYREQGGGRFSQLGEKLSSSASRARERVSDMASSSRERLSSGGHRLSSAADSARERAARLSDSARYRSHQARSGFQTMVREQPLLLGAIGLAVGAAAAAMLPTTRKEQEWMGEASERLTEQARAELDQQMEKGKRVVQAAGEAATDAAKEEAKRSASSPRSPSPGGTGPSLQ